MTTVFTKYDKNAIAQLPIVSFPGRIVVVQSESEAEKAVNFLMTQPIIGVDSETRPSFKKGISYKVSLLQVSTYDVCFLFRLKMMGGLTPSIIRLLEDKSVLKVGLSLKDDLCMLRKLQDFKPGFFVELQQMAARLGIQDMSLQKLYANIFGEKISKAQQLSNWEADTLTDKQKMYAATDAWCCIQLYEKMTEMDQLHNYQLVRQDPLIIPDSPKVEEFHILPEPIQAEDDVKRVENA